MAKKRPLGTCKLCQERKLLCDSHYLPKRLYEILNAPELKNPNPVMSINGALKQVSAQFRGFVFCESCEKLLNDRGEKWMLANLPTKSGHSCRLQEALAPMNPIAWGSRWERYDVSGSQAFDLPRMIYFAMSVFWRGAVHNWKTNIGQEAPSVDLGENQEPIRQFLLGASFPKNVILSVDIWPYKPIWPLLHPVVTEQLQAESRRCWFCVPGAYFFLFLGPRIPDDAKDSDVLRGFVSLDLNAADSIVKFFKDGVRSQFCGPEMDAMFTKIRAIRMPDS